MHLQIRVLWQGRDAEWDEWDGGAFAKWMQACEDEDQQQRELAAGLGVPAATAATLHRSSSQAFPGLRPQVWSPLKSGLLAPLSHSTSTKVLPRRWQSGGTSRSGLPVQVVVVGQNYKPLAQDPSAAAGDLASSSSGLEATAGPINVPKCRKLSKAKWKKSEHRPRPHAMHSPLPCNLFPWSVFLRSDMTPVLLCAGGEGSAGPSANSVEERYVRHVDAAASGAVETVEYDMDEEDEAWLAKYNKQVCFPQTLPSGHSHTIFI